MPNEKPSRDAIFCAAIEIAEQDKRDAYVAEASGGDAELRQQVAKLVAAHFQAGNFLENPAAGTATVSAGTTTDAIGTILADKYKLIEAIGGGGMGTVYMAQQTEPVKRLVAVKVIKAGMDSRSVLARFDAERQALAMMDHPNIARVFDAGATADGLPFFVMELVKGVPITRFCDDHKLNPRNRLELFVQVCQAIQHAHQKGIIHRDIKPSNVLVAMFDDRPVPKVIDFGVAKATGSQLTDHTLVTNFGAVVGTPEYMSPEQASFNQMDVDTRSDVYALGVLLYELLTGVTPVDRKSLGQAAVLEILRIVREVEPPRPSERLSTSEALPSIAANRHTEPSKLTLLLRGELDWVVMKALEKDRTRRYETANALARDVQRYLADEVVEARPPSAGYRLRKYVRKHKMAFAMAGMAAALLLFGIAATVWQAVRATDAEAEARENERQALLERDQKEQARKDAVRNEAKALAAAAAEKFAKEAEAVQRKKAEAAALAEAIQRKKAEAATVAEKKARDAEAAQRKQAEAVASLLESVFKGLDPKEAAYDLRKQLVDKLDAVAASLDKDYAGEPLLRARLREALGWTQYGLGEPRKAVVLHELALAERRQHLPPDHLDLFDSMNNLGRAYHGAGQLDKALPLLEQALKKSKTNLGPDHFTTLTIMGNLAEAYQDVRQFAKALPLFEQVLEKRKIKLSPEHPRTLSTMNSLAVAWMNDGQLDKALLLLKLTLEKRQTVLGLDHTDTITSLNNLALAYQAVGQLDKALPLHKKALATLKTTLGADHLHTLKSMNNLALTYKALGQTDKALPLLEQTAEKLKAKIGPDHPDTLAAQANLAAAYSVAHQLDKAVALFEQTLKKQKAKVGPDHPDTLTTMNNLAVAYQDAGQPKNAILLFEEALEKAKGKFGANNCTTLTFTINLAMAYQAAGKLDREEPLLREILIQRRRMDDQESLGVAGSLANLGLNLLRQGKYADAEPVVRECLAIRTQRMPEAWSTFNTHSMLGGSLLGQKKYAEAEPLLLKGYQGMKQREAKIPAIAKNRLTEALDRLIDLNTATNRPEEAKKLQAERARYGKSPPRAPKPPVK